MSAGFVDPADRATVRPGTYGVHAGRRGAPECPSAALLSGDCRFRVQAKPSVENVQGDRRPAAPLPPAANSPCSPHIASHAGLGA